MRLLNPDGTWRRFYEGHTKAGHWKIIPDYGYLRQCGLVTFLRLIVARIAYRVLYLVGWWPEGFMP